MELRGIHAVAGEGGRMGSPKRELLRSMKVGRKNQKNSSSHQQLLECIARANAGGGGSASVVCQEGVVRMKVLVKKEDLKQMLELLGDGGQRRQASPSPLPPPPRMSSSSVEQRLNLLRRKHVMRGNGGKGSKVSSSWIPALHSIPEEL